MTRELHARHAIVVGLNIKNWEQLRKEAIHLSKQSASVELKVNLVAGDSKDLGESCAQITALPKNFVEGGKMEPYYSRLVRVVQPRAVILEILLDILSFSEQMAEKATR